MPTATTVRPAIVERELGHAVVVPALSLLRSEISLDVPVVSVGALLDAASGRWGDRVAFDDRRKTLTFAQLWRHACGFAHVLVDRGVRPGEVIAVHLPNCLAFPVAYYGIMLAGATFGPTSPILPTEELTAQLADSGAVAVVTSEPSLPGALVTAGGDLLADLGATPADAPPAVDVDPAAAVAHLAYTGGTTGRSKGVVLTHTNVVANVLQSAAAATGSRPVVDSGGRVLLEQVSSPEEHPVRLGEIVTVDAAPWFHAMGAGSLTTGLLSGHTVVVHGRFDPARYLAEVEINRATMVVGAPSMFYALLAHLRPSSDLTSVRTVVSGGAPMPAAQVERVSAAMPNAVVVEGFGLTEATSGVCLASSARSGYRRIGTVGEPLPSTEVQLLTVESGRPGDDPVGVGERGELWVRGPQVMRGYHRRPEETARSLVDGWLRTGDIGVVGVDGQLAVVDRAKDMLLYKGYNVFPRELEELLVARPEVRAAAVVGMPDEAVGERPAAAVVLHPAEPADPSASAGVLAAAVNDVVRPYERLRAVFVVDELPVSAVGKVLKGALRVQLAEREALWTAD